MQFISFFSKCITALSWEFVSSLEIVCNSAIYNFAFRFRFRRSHVYQYQLLFVFQRKYFAYGMKISHFCAFRTDDTQFAIPKTVFLPDTQMSNVVISNCCQNNSEIYYVDKVSRHHGKVFSAVREVRLTHVTPNTHTTILIVQNTRTWWATVKCSSDGIQLASAMSYRHVCHCYKCASFAVVLFSASFFLSPSPCYNLFCMFHSVLCTKCQIIPWACERTSNGNMYKSKLKDTPM